MKNEEALQKLGNWYLAAFWLGMAAYSVALVQEGFQPEIALLTSCAAAIACVLHRGARRCRELAVNRALAEAIVPLAAFLVRVNQLIEAQRGSTSSIGLMLISFRSLGDGDEGEVPETVVKAVRGHVRHSVGSPVFQVNSRTLAMVEHGEDVGARLDQLSEELQSLFRAQRVTLPALTYARMTVGIAVAGNRPGSGAELFATARAALDLAEESTREIFVRQV